MKSLNQLVREEWNLQAWDIRYGKGIQLMIGPSAVHVDLIRDITGGPDIPAVTLELYFRGYGSWLPVVEADSISEALQLLEEKVTRLIGDVEWKDCVFTGFQEICGKDDGGYGLENAIENDAEGIYKKPHWK
ncbi:hypothetical protein [Paenibacillus gansuensis]|uniref:Uncharacterized protein n=1 Tax=Paenibacillus gansuensis TaxID=306542 RepID=A0ABW5PHT1_9BACL